MMAEVTPELVRQLLDGTKVRGSGSPEVRDSITKLRELARELAAAYLQVCKERDELREPLSEEIRMSAYYYGFDKTGVAIIDRILSAVARAGKASHHTDMWSDTDEQCPVSYADQIQKAADTAAQAILGGSDV